jgi:hypothetical protein
VVACGAQERVEGLTAIAGVIGIGKNVNVKLERHRLNLDYLDGKKMKERRKAPKAQFESRIMASM